MCNEIYNKVNQEINNNNHNLSNIIQRLKTIDEYKINKPNKIKIRK